MPDYIESGSWVRARIDKKFAEFLHDSRIFSCVRKGQASRWIESNFVSFAKTTKIEPYSAVYMGELLYEMGSFSFVTTPFNVNAYGLSISFGRYCSIGGGAQITGPAHPLTSVSTATALFDGTVNFAAAYFEDEAAPAFPFVKRPTPKGPPRIGHDVWFGGNVWLNTGVRIGNGAVVAANSMVTRDVPDYAIVGGNPAQIIRYRFPDAIISELQAIRPWDYALKDLGKLDVSDIEAFIKGFSDINGDIRPYAPNKAHIWEEYKKIHNI